MLLIRNQRQYFKMNFKLFQIWSLNWRMEPDYFVFDFECPNWTKFWWIWWTQFLWPAAIRKILFYTKMIQKVYVKSAYIFILSKNRVEPDFDGVHWWLLSGWYILINYISHRIVFLKPDPQFLSQLGNNVAELFFSPWKWNQLQLNNIWS